jgi:hypothetical protein
MAQTNPPKGDRIGNDYREGTNPNPGGEIETGDALIPPYEGRNEGRNERAEGPDRMLSGEAPPKQPTQPESKAPPRPDADMAPEGVGESASRRGEDAVKQDGKEAGREDKGTKGQSDRPVGSSNIRDKRGI